jgi:hypothetical protein
MVTRLRRDGSFVGSLRRPKTEAGPNSSTGSADRHASDNRLSLRQRATQHRGCAILSAELPADRSNLSVPPARLLKTMARPPKGGRSLRGPGEDSRPRSGLRPGANGVGAVIVRLGRRAASVVAGVSNGALSAGSGRGANPKHRGPGLCRNGAKWSRAPSGQPRRTRSPSSPQFGRQHTYVAADFAGRSAEPARNGVELAEIDGENGERRVHRRPPVGRSGRHRLT